MNIMEYWGQLEIEIYCIMMRQFPEINHSLSENMLEDAISEFQSHQSSQCKVSLHSLPKMLENIRIALPESMMKEYLKAIKTNHNPQINFIQFTHYIARASLELEVQQQLANLFSYIDRDDSGTINAEDIWHFIQSLQHNQQWNQIEVDSLMLEMDMSRMGFLTFEDFLYSMLPK